ncbi:MAG: hypothetical protein ABSH50_13440 [Bryobacteraceae bacterium]
MPKHGWFFSRNVPGCAPRPTSLNVPKSLHHASARYLGIGGDPVHEFDHVVFGYGTFQQPVPHVFAEFWRKMLPVNAWHGLVGIVRTENHFLNLFPLLIGIGCIRFGLEFANYFTQLSFPSYSDLIYKHFAGAEHIYHGVALQCPSGFYERLCSDRLSRFENAIDGHEKGAVLLKMAHLENFIPELLPHPPNVSGWDLQIPLGDLFEELDEVQHLFPTPDLSLGFSMLS